MSGYYVIEPEVAGGWGKNTEAISVPGNPVRVNKLHYVFDGWLGDELLESTPSYIGSDRLVDEIKKAQLNGVEFDDVEVTKSQQFDELYPNRALPSFKWLKVYGIPGKDDFGITDELSLVVSERALEALRNIGISNANIEHFDF